MKNEKKTYKARNVHVLRPDVPTIHALEERDELAHRRLPIAVKIRIPKKPVVRCPEVRRRRCQLQWCWAQATPDSSALELTSSVPGGYLSDALVVYAEQHGESAPLAVLQLGCCGSSGRAWQLWRSRQSK